MNTLRIITLSGAPHPLAAVQSLDPASGTLVFAWLDAEQKCVDSGGSVARFTPPLPLQPEDFVAPAVYPEIPDKVLAAAIAASLVDPAPAVPEVISRAEFVISLRRVLGLTEGGIYAIISMLPEGEQRETARDLWENAREFRRDNSFLAALAQLNGNTPAQLDEVFRTGAALDLD